ncbi:MAG TPA: OmpA family protein [Methylomirabilota bacterium]|nr:OmpA family protein [Methylomirabilota bacterium]
MANQQTQWSSGKEVAMLVGVLVMVAAGMVTTYWVRSGGAQTPSAPAAVTTAPVPSPRPHVVSAPIPTDSPVVHADIYFDFKSTRLRADAVRLLQEKAGMMDRSSVWAVLVQGYADRQGPPEYNRMLAQRRAETVKQFLVELGVFETQVKVITIGQEGSLCDEPSRECQQLNRRVHIEIRKLARTSAVPVRPQIAVGDVLNVSSVGGDTEQR